MTSSSPPREGQVLIGPLFSEPMRVETARPNGPDSWELGLVGLRSERFRKVSLTASDLAHLSITESRFSYDGDGRLLRLGSGRLKSATTSRPPGLRTRAVSARPRCFRSSGR